MCKKFCPPNISRLLLIRRSSAVGTSFETVYVETISSADELRVLPFWNTPWNSNLRLDISPGFVALQRAPVCTLQNTISNVSRKAWVWGFSWCLRVLCGYFVRWRLLYETTNGRRAPQIKYYGKRFRSLEFISWKRSVIGGLKLFLYWIGVE